MFFFSFVFISVCKSGLGTEKRPEPDWTRTCQDQKLVGPIRTVTAVQSMVPHKSKKLEIAKRLVELVLASLQASARDI